MHGVNACVCERVHVCLCLCLCVCARACVARDVQSQMETGTIFFLALMVISLMSSGSMKSLSMIFSYLLTSPVNLTSDFLA